MKGIVASLMFVLFAASAFSQSGGNLLECRAENSSVDTAEVLKLLHGADNLYFDDVAKFRQYMYKAKALLERVPFKRGFAYYYYLEGLMNINAPSIALDSYNKSLKLYAELKDAEGVAGVYLALGAMYVNQSRVDKGMPCYLAALRIFQSQNDKDNIGICYSNIGGIYSRQKKYAEALEYSKKALSYYETKNHKYYGEYVQIANCYSLLGKVKTALHYYDTLERPLTKKRYFDLLSNVYTNMGAIYEDLGQYAKAQKYYHLSYYAAAKISDVYYLASACINLADLYVQQNLSDSSIALLERNYSVIKQLGSKKFLRDYYLALSSAYEKKNDAQLSLAYYKRYKIASDSLNSERSNQRLYELQTAFEVDRKNEEIVQLNKDNRYKSLQLSKQRTIIFLVLFSSLLLIIAIGILYSRFRLKKKLAHELAYRNRTIEQQQQEILAMNDMLEKQNLDLLELDNMKSRFFTNISHEFRTPLSLIIGPLNTMQERVDGGGKKEISLMLKHANGLLNLVNQLLDLSRLQKASLRLYLSHGDINGFLHSIVDAFAVRAVDLGIALSYNSSALPLFVWFDKDKLEKVVVNLVSNALKHTSKGGFVTVSLARVDAKAGYAEIVVSDNGLGIESHELKNIFEPFYQAEATINRKIEGSGVGLALVKELVELHGGTIAVSSEAGKGAKFTVRVAVDKEQLPSAEILVDEVEFDIAHSSSLHWQENSALDEVSAKVVKGRTTVLVVEDNDDMRRYISQMLLHDYQVVEAANGMEGFDKAVEVLPDLIVSDVMMPLRNGYEMTRLIKTDQRTSHIPVIILTAKVSEQSKIKGLEYAADDYVVKPFNEKELLLRIRNAIANRQRLRDKFQRCITVNPSEVTATSMDEQFLTKALQIVERHLSESEYSVEDFCDEIGISRTQVHRKLKALTDQSFTEFMRCVRLKRAASLLSMKAGNLTEIAYKTGFTNLSYFSRSFKKEFGISPSEYCDPENATNSLRAPKEF